MKVINLLIGFLLILLLASNTLNKKNGLAEVNKMQGVYLFTDSEPVQEYEHLGTVGNGAYLGSSQYEGVRNNLLKKALKKYPNADGVIFHLHDGGSDKADAIKFKD